MSNDFDLFVIGAGSGGVRAARMAAKAGARVAIAEERFLGGTCVNVGCVPKKLLVYAAALRDEMAGAAGFGWTGEGTFDWPSLIRNKDAEIARLNGVYERLLHGAGCTLLSGRARLIDAHTVELRDEHGANTRYRAEHVLVATGSQPIRPSEPGSERGWISDDVFYLESMPERLLVVGGGYIALEMASIFRGLGSEVTLAYRGPHPLRGFDDDARFFLVEEMRKKGVRFLMNTSVRCLEDGPNGSIEAELSHEEELEVDAVLYAIGRSPNTSGIGLEALGVERTETGAIVVDEHYQSSVPSIYALGDVIERATLTPVAIAQAMSFVGHVFGHGRPPGALRHRPHRGLLPAAAGHGGADRGGRARSIWRRSCLHERVPTAEAHAERQLRACVHEARGRREERSGAGRTPGRRGERRDHPGLRRRAHLRSDQGPARRHRRPPPDGGRGAGHDARAPARALSDRPRSPCVNGPTRSAA